MNSFAKLLIKLAFYVAEHPDLIKGWVEAIHAAKQPQPVAP